ncbi:isomerizing glutamine--fructose-6-phosphate transaminase [Alcanivorax sp.]|uniref:isomerizing glutamine--fructose-6-phosphate transaminase n=1 Tax=Alcanivorax sp. TaxID=1872427 RepID=UPI0025B99779|nr:isomerizing glutamine--fructose-6-phosphate transaminase [Alcanivorax sp.]
MCGIVGAIAQRNVTNILITGLKRLEYRGYDSAGVALLNDSGITRVRRQGKVAGLEAATTDEHASGFTGIAHTRWATHGKPSEANAHPHMSGSDLALVHNGIIENFQELKDELEAAGYAFQSQTDTEVIVHLLHQVLATGVDLFTAVQQVVKKLDGAYALGVIHKDEPHKLVAVRSGSPLVIGLGIDENYIASDQLALLPVTNRFIFLEEGDQAEISTDNIRIVDAQGNPANRDTHEFDGTHEDAEKGEYRHYMQKEIFEQPAAIQKTSNQKTWKGDREARRNRLKQHPPSSTRVNRKPGEPADLRHQPHAGIDRPTVTEAEKIPCDNKFLRHASTLKPWIQVKRQKCHDVML